jgi:hypothetical protein
MARIERRDVHVLDYALDRWHRLILEQLLLLEPHGILVIVG